MFIQEDDDKNACIFCTLASFKETIAIPSADALVVNSKLVAMAAVPASTSLLLKLPEISSNMTML